MSTPRQFTIVEDDEFTIELMSKILTDAGHRVDAYHDSRQALEAIKNNPPDCVITDLMMPGMDGFELCQRVREVSDHADLKIIVVTGKTYEYDERRARALGADGYITKPIKHDALMDQLQRILSSRLNLQFWGVHGTLPVSGPEFIRYGGSTSCVSLTFPDNEIFVFDGGTGIRGLGNHLMKGPGRSSGKIFISHPHWDHINALPFFAPLYQQGNEFEVLGPSHSDMDMRQLIGAQMDSVYFPITMREFGAHMTFHDLHEETVAFDDVVVRTLLLSHPGNCLGYRIEYAERTICYVTDNELFLPDSPQHNPEYVNRLTEFVRDADLLITDTTYTDDGYKTKVGWGHSCVSQVAELAHAADVGQLYLFHHDPEDTDDDIDAKLEQMRQHLSRLDSAVEAIAPAEGDTVEL